MIQHIVLFDFKAEVQPSDRDWLLSQARKLTGIDSVRRLSVGKLLDPREEWYRRRMAADYPYALSVEFDDEDGLYVYQKDPFHVTFAQELRSRASAVRVMDFVSS